MHGPCTQITIRLIIVTSLLYLVRLLLDYSQLVLQQVVGSVVLGLVRSVLGLVRSVLGVV